MRVEFDEISRRNATERLVVCRSEGFSESGAPLQGFFVGRSSTRDAVPGSHEVAPLGRGRGIARVCPKNRSCTPMSRVHGAPGISNSGRPVRMRPAGDRLTSLARFF